MHASNKNQHALTHVAPSTCPVRRHVCLMFCQRRLFIAEHIESRALTRFFNLYLTVIPPLKYSKHILANLQKYCNIMFISKVYFIIKITEICTASKNIFIHTNMRELNLSQLLIHTNCKYSIFAILRLFGFGLKCVHLIQNKSKYLCVLFTVLF